MECQTAFKRVVSKLKINPAQPRSVAATEHRQLMIPLIRLRQACCHPQLGTHGVERLKIITQAGKGVNGDRVARPMTMSAILHKLKAQVRK